MFMGYKNALDRYIEATNSHSFSNVRTWVDSDAVYWFSDKTSFCCIGSIYETGDAEAEEAGK